MTVLEMSNNLILLSERVKEQTQDANKVAAARGRLDRFEKLVDDIEQLSAFFSLAEQHGFGTHPELSTSEWDSLEELVTVFDATAIESPFDALQGPDFELLSERLTRLVTDWRQGARSTWEQHVDDLLPADQRQLLEASEPHLDSELRLVVGRITTRDQLLLTRARNRPNSSQEYEELARMVQERQDWFESLGLATSPEIQSFLEATVGEGFPLEDLTPGIEAWMNDRGLRTGFVIRTRPAK